ncbi:glycosyltransferase [Flavobacteriaceae bacterium]|jgi:glycosyltransferase involved in cell wall biosynthesis|nr:glycosyltransferase [Flavobacteriaceae bacterium]
MKVLQIITRNIAGGAQTVLAHIANSLVQKGHQVSIVAGEGDGSLWTILDERIEMNNCPTLKRSLSVKGDWKTILYLRKVYNEYQPDIIHVHSSKAGLLGRLALPKKKIVYTVHGYDSIRNAFPIFRPVEYLMQYMCAAVVGVSRYDEIKLKEDRIRRNVSFIYNGIPEKGCDTNLRWNIPNRYKKTILCVARVSPQKNLDLFLKIAKLLPQYAFVWIGNSEKIDHQFENVFFLGNIPAAGRYCYLCDLFILTSNYEGLPMTIIEAMSYGKPIVASNVGGISEIVENSKNGFISDNDEYSFKTCIESVFASENTYKNMAENSRKIYLNKLTVEKMVDGYLNIYKSIISNN